MIFFLIFLMTCIFAMATSAVVVMVVHAVFSAKTESFRAMISGGISTISVPIMILLLFSGFGSSLSIDWDMSHFLISVFGAPIVIVSLASFPFAAFISGKLEARHR